MSSMKLHHFVVVFMILFSVSNFGHVTCHQELPRKGEEIIVAGKLYNIGTRVVTFLDEFGYDAYRTECRFTPWNESSYEVCVRKQPDPKPGPSRYNLRTTVPSEIEAIRGGGWNLTLLQKYVNKFVLHYDVAGFSKNCFRVLHDARFLSVHFMLDVDGILYQTLDLKERAWHAGIANSNSIGIEIANMGAYGVNATNPFSRWYRKDEQGRTTLILPKGWSSISSDDYIGHPIRNDPVVGMVQGGQLMQYDLTKEQYVALAKLTISLSKIFPSIVLDYPKRNGQLVRETLSQEEMTNFNGILGHWHISRDKIDPGPAFNWQYYEELLKEEVHHQNQQEKL